MIVLKLRADARVLAARNRAKRDCLGCVTHTQTSTKRINCTIELVQVKVTPPLSGDTTCPASREQCLIGPLVVSTKSKTIYNGY